MKHLFVGAGLPANRVIPHVATSVRGQARSYGYGLICILLAGNLFAATPAGNKPAEKEQATQQQVKPVDSSKLKTGTPATTFTPSEKVGADSAVSFPVDI